MYLAASVRASLIAHAREEAPDEACGLLGGRSGTQPVVQTSIRTANIAAEPTYRFEIDPEALLAGRDRLESAGQELIGFYHSHPKGPAEPSETDQEAARWDQTYTVIVSLDGPDPTIGAWFDTGESYRPEPIEIRPKRR